MENHKNATKGGSDAQRGILPIPSSCEGEAGKTGDVFCDLRTQVASLEDALSQMGTSSKTPFCFVWYSILPSEQSFSPKHQQSNPVHEDWSAIVSKLE